ncbi:hypothetical protein GTY74_30085 [Streptomyces sp. SID8350]|nr:hypothetical protein [Streptomyces sp. SID8350]
MPRFRFPDLSCLTPVAWFQFPDPRLRLRGVLARAVHRDLPESVDTYVRTRRWTRMAPGRQDPEEQLVRQLALLHGEFEELVAGLREAEEIRRQTRTRYPEDRGTGSTYGTGTAPGT